MSLPESHLHILLVLAEGDAHGYRIMQTTVSMTEGAVKLRPGALYAALGKLVDTGLIGETDERPVAELDDQRRRYYRITPEGREVLGAEIRRLARVVRRATALEPSWGLA